MEEWLMRVEIISGAIILMLLGLAKIADMTKWKGDDRLVATALKVIRKLRSFLNFPKIKE